VKQTQGKIEVASGGTLFLDEIGDMPQSLQAKLLRFLQDAVERTRGHDRSRWTSDRLRDQQGPADDDRLWQL
jgi:transcriptional regulator with GAF, ATPase, and Fis domain